MNKFHIKLGEDGRVVLPAVYRRHLQLLPGEELIIWLEDDELHLTSLKHSLKKAQDIVQKYAKKRSLVKMLKEMRQEDLQHEKNRT